MEEEIKILETDTYDIIKEKLEKYQDGKYKKYILEHNDFEFKYGFTIFDVENKDKNKKKNSLIYWVQIGRAHV